MERFRGFLVRAYEKTRRWDQAEGLLEEIVARARRVLPPQHPQLAGLLARLALVRLQGRKYEQAEAVARECLSIRQGLAPDDWSTFNAQVLLGAALLGQKQYANAEPLLRRLSRLEAQPPDPAAADPASARPCST